MDHQNGNGHAGDDDDDSPVTSPSSTLPPVFDWRLADVSQSGADVRLLHEGLRAVDALTSNHAKEVVRSISLLTSDHREFKEEAVRQSRKMAALYALVEKSEERVMASLKVIRESIGDISEAQGRLVSKVVDLQAKDVVLDNKVESTRDTLDSFHEVGIEAAKAAAIDPIEARKQRRQAVITVAVALALAIISWLFGRFTP